MLEFTAEQASALSVLARGVLANAKFKDYQSVTKTLSGDALSVARLMYGQPDPGKRAKEKEKELKVVVNHYKQWAKSLPRLAPRER